MDRSTEPVEAEFVRLLNELEDKPKGLTVTELQMTDEVRFEIPQGPAFINGKWYW